MRAFFVSLALGLLTATTSVGQSSELQTLNTGTDARGWEAVGRLDIVGKGFCTGTLIEPDLVLTAAHCLYDSEGAGQVNSDDIEFLAGLRYGRPEAVRNARSFLVHPEYQHNDGEDIGKLRYDVALVVLNRPIRATEIPPFSISNGGRVDSEIGVVSYARGRAEAPSLQELCNLLGIQRGVMIMDCQVNFGASGAPVFRYEDGQARLVSVISAMSVVDGEDVALAPDLTQPLPFMLNQIESLQTILNNSTIGPPPTSRTVDSEQRGDTGALFVRP